MTRCINGLKEGYIPDHVRLRNAYDRQAKLPLTPLSIA
jgi:hypothetical protein